MIRFEEGPRPPAAIGIAPLIDVVFLLLIFFMVTSSLTRPEADLPSALKSDRQGGAAARAQARGSTTVTTIDPMNSVRRSKSPSRGNHPVLQSELSSTLVRKVQACPTSESTMPALMRMERRAMTRKIARTVVSSERIALGLRNGAANAR